MGLLVESIWSLIVVWLFVGNEGMFFEIIEIIMLFYVVNRGFWIIDIFRNLIFYVWVCEDYCVEVY